VVVFDIVWMLPTFADAAIGYLVVTSITVIALYSAHALPIFLRLRLGARFRQGAWTLGRHYRWVDSIALVLFGGWWLLSARHWFPGPVRQASFEELEAASRSTTISASMRTVKSRLTAARTALSRILNEKGQNR
jgi:hypothetical protein